MRDRWVFAACCLALSACGPGVAEGPLFLTEAAESTDETEPSDEDTGDTETEEAAGTDSATVDDGEPSTHSETESVEKWCEEPLGEDETIIRAEELVPGGELVAMSNDCVLLRKVEEGGIRATVVFLSSELEPPFEAKRVETVMDQEPLSITCYDDPLLDDRLAVILMSGNGEVTLMRASFDSGEMGFFEGSEPLGSESLTRVVRLLKTAGNGINRLCALGDGLFCLDLSADDGEWEAEIPSDQGGFLRDVGVMAQGEAWRLVAVGDGGRIDVVDPEGWRTLPPVTDADLLTVSIDDDLLVAAGEGGVFVYGTRDKQTEAVRLEGDVISLNFWDGQPFTGVTARGEVFRGSVDDGELRFCPTVSLSESALDSLSINCGSFESFLVLTGDALIGNYGCDMVIAV